MSRGGRRGSEEGIVKSLTGRASNNDDLLDLEETIRRLKPFSRHYLGMRSIPVDHVVGTEGRAGDFDRRFSPRRRHVSERMRSVSEAFPDGDFPAIVVHQLGEAYFVIDGHHRVAVARRRGTEYIDAEVTELRSDWTLPADADMSHIIHVEQQRWFEEASGLAQARPETRIELSRTADYVELLETVQIHGYHLMRKLDRVLPPPEIAVDWYERVYAPVTEEVRRETVPGNGQTEGDFFLQLYRLRRDRYAERGCPALEEIVAEAMVRPSKPWARWWHRWGPGAEQSR
jgi:hypothetical protein